VTVVGPTPVVGSGRELARFREDGFGGRVLLDDGRMRVVLVVLEEGQEIPLHSPALDLAVAVLEGTGRLWAGDREQWVMAGDVAIVPAGATRGLRSEGGRLVALNVVSPPPGPADHEQGVGQAWPAPMPAPDLAAMIRSEHRGLHARVGELRSLAELARTLAPEPARERLTEVVGFLREELLAHAAEEERSIYPAVERVLRAAGGATETMKIDHGRIAELTSELEEIVQSSLDEEWRTPLRQRLHSLAALLEVHLRKEEEVYLPLLERLGPQQRRSLHRHLSGQEPDAS
jgi:quercetin dioxygenase-like cupin family protein/iron-sulfur cluster repair protein YtfE (RIC family)